MKEMFTRRSILALATGGMAAAALAAPAIGKSSGNRVLLGQPSSGFIYLPLYAARKLGYFEEEGLEAEFIVFQKGGAEAMAALIGGQSDIYIGSPGVQLRAQEKGQAIKSFASVMSQWGSQLIISAGAAKQVKLDELTDPRTKAAALKGLKIAVAGPGSLTDLMVRHIAKYGGLEPDRDVTIVPVGGGSNMLAAFGQERVDGYALSAPTSTIGMQQFGGRMLFDFSKGEYPPFADFSFYTLIARDQWLVDDKENAKKLVRGLWRGLKLMKEKPDEAREAVYTFFPKVEKPIFDVVWQQSLGAFGADPLINPDGMQKNFDFLEAGDGKPVNVALKDSYTNEIVEAVAKSM
ncbi:ABC transporter substrate-binding protein [Xanthobacter sp. DSM 24535]|uniref:ABC transporter substrate-binding protein n=1 Tax=Roseixanthobacter psychrophilus TaxID=3119917 RepID=UPI00372778F7